MIRISAFRWVPPFAEGLVRDFRVRWSLEEAGLGYQARLIGPGGSDFRELSCPSAFRAGACLRGGRADVVRVRRHRVVYRRAVRRADAARS